MKQRREPVAVTNDYLQRLIVAREGLLNGVYLQFQSNRQDFIEHMEGQIIPLKLPVDTCARSLDFLIYAVEDADCHYSDLSDAIDDNILLAVCYTSTCPQRVAYWG